MKKVGFVFQKLISLLILNSCHVKAQNGKLYDVGGFLLIE